jgi:O-antigen/teichoic acid export membrane protein
MIKSKAFFHTSLSQLILVFVEITKVFFLGRFFDSNNFGIYFLVLTSSLFISESIRGYAQIIYIDTESERTLIYDTLFKTIILMAVLSFIACVLLNINKVFYIYMPILIVLYGTSGVYEMNMIKEREFFNLGFLKALGGLTSLSPLFFLPYISNNKIHFVLLSTILLTIPIIIFNLKNQNNFKLTKKFSFNKNGLIRALNIFFLLLNNNFEKYVVKLILGNSALGEYTMAQSVGRKLEQKLNPITNTIVLPILQDRIGKSSKNNDFINQTLLLLFYYTLSVIFILLLPSLTNFFFKNNWGDMTLMTMLFVLIGYIYSYETILKNRLLLEKSAIKNLFKFDLISFCILISVLFLTFFFSERSFTLIRLIYLLIGFKCFTNFLFVLEIKTTTNPLKANILFYFTHTTLSSSVLLLIFKMAT